ncbi:MAG: hypothetical protein JKY08_03760 [Flavobacteriaceae bacterium]|nr:hypothetical protein [Flavobacteriaceae bacterium]
MKLIFSIFSFLLIVTSSYSQIEKSSLQYKVIELDSEYFPNEKRTIKIFLPKGYDTTKKHPIIYTLDGDALFDMTSNYVKQLSKTVIQNDYDYGFDVIPQSIVVGIFHKNRGYETTPNFSKYSNGDETVYKEGSEKLKNFLFKEVVPFINSNYKTSGYNSIIGHSNTAHFVMCLPLQKNNPFNGIISMSLSGDSKIFKNKIKTYLERNNNTNIFIGYGSKDFGFNEFAKYIESSEVSKDNLKIRKYNANHNEMPALSLVNGLKFLFKEYRNIDNFNQESTKKEFDIKQYLKEYQRKNLSCYGIETKMKEDDFYSLLDLSIISKNKKVFNQIVDYELEVNKNPIQNHMLFVYNKQLGDFKKAEIIAYNILESKIDFDNRVLNGQLESYYSFFIKDLKEPKKAINFFKNGKVKFPKHELEYRYFIAKASIENNYKKRLGKTNLKYCIKNYKQNKYFTKFDLDKLRKE